MSQQPGWTPTPPTTPAKKARRWPWIAGLAVASVVGFGIGSSGDPEPDAATPAPAETVTVTKTQDKTPAACVEALDAAEAVIALASQSLDIVSDSFEAVSEFDADRVEENTAKLNAITPKITVQRDAYNPAAKECRAS